MSDDERPKKSWRDIDKGRDRSGGASPRRDPDQHGRAKVEKTAAYSKYKSQLDKLFVPGGAALPESMRDKLGPTSEASKAQRSALDALRQAPNAETLAAVLAQNAPLPDDPRLLLSLLEIKDEAMLMPVLRALEQAIEAGKKPNRMLLLQKIDALKNRVSDDEIVAVASAIRERME